MEAVSDAKVRVEHFSFPSTEGTVDIHAVVWMPQRPVRDAAMDAKEEAASDACAPRGIVQLVHGMTEYIDRYDAFARFLVGEGYVVCGHDHLAHGKSIRTKSDWGDLPAQDGARVLVEDVHVLRGIIQERFGSKLPYALFGHSMGSFVVRAYVARHASGLSGAIVCGTADQPAMKSKAGNAFARFLASTRGNAHRSALVHGMADGAYSKAIPNARTDYDWLSNDKSHVDAYLEDEACGFMFSVGGYAALTQLTAWNADPKQTVLIPDGLPLLLIAGAEDPVGDFGKGVTAVYDRLKAAGKDAELRLYDGMRHELVNCVGREAVWGDIAEWLARKVG